MSAILKDLKPKFVMIKETVNVKQGFLEKNAISVKKMVFMESHIALQVNNVANI